MMNVNAVVWHFWLAPLALVPLSLTIIIGVLVGYVVKVVRPQYPKKQ